MNHRALVATSRFRDLAGSEITALEVATELGRQGWEVTLASFEVGGLPAQAAAEAGVEVVALSSLIGSDHEWGLVWVIHPMTYYFLCVEYHVQADTLIYSSLSHFEPIESPPIILHPIDLFTVNSQEHHRFFVNEYPEYSGALEIFPNSVPQSFVLSAQEIISEQQAVRLAVVSNHPPEELLEAINRLRNRGLSVDIFGVGGIVRKITPDLLRSYNAVVSIGKTVQYALWLGVPVFCYDHFGGPGWIRPDNIDRAFYYNFSGRDLPTRLGAEELFLALYSFDAPDSAETAALASYAATEFNLGINLNGILSRAKDLSKKRHVTLKATQDSGGIQQNGVTFNNVLRRHNEIMLRGRVIENELREAIVDYEKSLAEVSENANKQVLYRDSLVSELRGQLGEVEKNADAQIKYRDALVTELKQQLIDVNQNSDAQIRYRDALVAEIGEHLTRVKQDSDAEILRLSNQVALNAAAAAHENEVSKQKGQQPLLRRLFCKIRR